MPNPTKTAEVTLVPATRNHADTWVVWTGTEFVNCYSAEMAARLTEFFNKEARRA